MTDTVPAALDAAAVQHEPPVELLTEPRDGVPEPVQTSTALAEVVAAFAAGRGPVAIDAERASGYRYGQRAYLVQLRRAGARTALIDPVALPDLAPLQAAIGDAEWVLHAASQDLPCLAEIGLVPRRLFDTELAGRLAGFARVSLGAMVEDMLGLRLEKGYSAADWSTRPLPQEWLRYAALDVEVLLELRAAMLAELTASGKLEWAREEFAAIVRAGPPVPRLEPWRRTSGINRVRTRRQLAALRALWTTRDQIARARDTAPGRVLPDAALVAAVLAGPASVAELIALPVFSGRSTRRHAGAYLTALHRAAALPEDELPAHTGSGDGPPPAQRWAERDAPAAARLAPARTALTSLAAQHRLPVENLLAPDAVRRLCWTPPAVLTQASIEAWLGQRGARSWQIRLTAAALVDALHDG